MQLTFEGDKINHSYIKAVGQKTKTLCYQGYSLLTNKHVKKVAMNIFWISGDKSGKFSELMDFGTEATIYLNHLALGNTKK